MVSLRPLHLGHKIAPVRFILFLIVLVGGSLLLEPMLGLGRGAMVAFDAGALAFFATLVPLFFDQPSAEAMRERSKNNDANRALLLAITGLVMLVVLVAVANEMHGRDQLPTTLLVLGTLTLAWFFSNAVYALHYAHLYYSDADGDGNHEGGLDFPGTKEPDYWDFLYFSFTLGMTFQTSDTGIGSARMRRAALGHSVAAFFFNLGVIAFTINVLGSSSTS